MAFSMAPATAPPGAFGPRPAPCHRWDSADLVNNGFNKGNIVEMDEGILHM